MERMKKKGKPGRSPVVIRGGDVPWGTVSQNAQDNAFQDEQGNNKFGSSKEMETPTIDSTGATILKEMNEKNRRFYLPSVAMTAKWTQGDQTNSNNPEIASQDTLSNPQEINSALEVIRKVMITDAAQPFNTPVDPIALGIPDYFDVIDKPMDFGTICKNLKNGMKYKNSKDVLNDVQYIWGNCSKYYTKGHYLLELMKRLKKKFTKYWTEAGLLMEQSQEIDGRASLHPIEHNLRGNTNEQCASVGPYQHQDQINRSQPQPYQHPRNYNMFYPPIQRPHQHNMSSYNHQTPYLHGDKNGGFSGKRDSRGPFGPGSLGGQILWRNDPISSRLYQHRPSFGNGRPFQPQFGSYQWQPHSESVGRRYPYEQGYTTDPIADHPTHVHQNQPSVHPAYLPTPPSTQTTPQTQHKSFQSQPLLISDDETDPSSSDVLSPSPMGYMMRSGNNGPSSSIVQPHQPSEGAARVQMSSTNPQPSHLQACSHKEGIESSQIVTPQPVTSFGQPHQPQPPPGFDKEVGCGPFPRGTWRCRRTDGKKWQCSQYTTGPNTKYCERHMNRGRRRSRIEDCSLSTPVEPTNTTNNHQAGIDDGQADNHEDQVPSSQIVHPEPSPNDGGPPQHPKGIAEIRLGSSAARAPKLREGLMNAIDKHDDLLESSQVVTPQPSSNFGPPYPQAGIETQEGYSCSLPAVEFNATDNHQGQVPLSQIVHPEPSSTYGEPPQQPEGISEIQRGSNKDLRLDKREAPRKRPGLYPQLERGTPQLKFSKVQLGSSADARLVEKKTPHLHSHTQRNLFTQIMGQDKLGYVETLDGHQRQRNLFTQIMGQDRFGYVQVLDGPSRTEPETTKMVSMDNEVAELKEKMVSMEKTCAQMATQIATMVSTMSDMQKKLSYKDGAPPNPLKAADVSNDSGALPSASGVIIRDLFSRVYPRK